MQLLEPSIQWLMLTALSAICGGHSTHGNSLELFQWPKPVALYCLSAVLLPLQSFAFFNFCCSFSALSSLLPS
jgi:hypothetical protein